MLEAVGGRTFVLAVLLIAAGIALTVLNPGSLTTELVTLILGVFGLFCGKNTFITATGMKLGIGAQPAGAVTQEEQEAPSTPPAVTPAPVARTAMAPDLDHLKQELAMLKETQAAIAQSVSNTNKLLSAALTQK